jgi:hypothetical protein
MYWRRVLPVLLLAGNALAAEGWIAGVGAEGDTTDGLAGVAFADVAVAEKTWLTASIGGNTVELPRRRSINTRFGRLGIDHWFDPVGVKLEVAYWGDSDVLDSRDWGGSLYWRSDRVMLAGDYEYRDFRFTIPATQRFPGRTVDFDAHGVGLTTRFDLTESLNLGFAGMTYDYSVDLRLDDNRGLLDLLSFSRLSLINSLVDYTAFVTLGLDVGERNWQLEAGTWRGAVDGGTTTSATLRFLTPLGRSSDVELGIGLDDSDLYGSVTFFSVFLYFYGD